MDKVASWLHIIGNFAVLVGLVFVGYQLIQDREMKRNEMLDLGWQINFERVYQVMGEDIGEVIAKAATSPSDLEADEHYRLMVYFDSIMLQYRRDAMLQRIGMRPPEWQRRDLPQAFRTTAGKRHLERILAMPEDENLDWSIPNTVRERWAEQIADPAFSEELGIRLKALEASK